MDEVKSNNKQGIKPKQTVNKENSIEELSKRLDSLNELFTSLHGKIDNLISEVELTNHVGRIMIELLGGVSPGRKNLGNLEIVKLRNEGVKVKDLAKMQGISECAMSRKLKELREAGVLHDQGKEDS